METHLPCICCQKSLNRIGGARRRSFPLTSQFVEDNLFLMNYFVEVVGVQGFSPTNRICRPCFQRAQRYVRARQDDGQYIKEEPAVELYHIEEHDCQVAVDAMKQEVNPLNQIDSLLIKTDNTEYHQHNEPNAVKHETSLNNSESLKQDNKLLHIESSQCNGTHDTTKHESRTHVDRGVQASKPVTILLSEYTRTPLNVLLCIFATCSNRNLQRINVDTRAAILQKKLFYIPHGARVCEEHEEQLFAIALHELAELNIRRISTEFTSQHINDMLNLLREYNK